MRGERIETRRLSAAAWGAVLAPAVAILPGMTARRAGEGAWLAPLVALPAALLLGWMLKRLARDGLAQTFVRLLGGVFGRVLTIIYIMWALLLAGARLRLSGQRLLFTARREEGLWFYLGVLAIMAAWLAWGKAEGFVRAAAVYSRVLTFALLTVLGLTAFQIRPENLFPLWAEDVLPVLSGAVRVLGVLCYGVYAAFLWQGGDGGGWERRTAGGCALLALLQLSVLGNLGAQLAAQLEDPFITLSKRVGVEGAFQRVESLVSALWLLGDLALLGLLLWACRRMMEVLLPKQRGNRISLAGAAVILGSAGLLFREAIVAWWFEYEVAPVGNLVLGAAVPVILFFLAVREKRKQSGISCALWPGDGQI